MVISPAGRSQALPPEQDYGDFYVEIGYGIVKDASTVSGNVTTYTGVQLILDFVKTVEAVLMASTTDLGGSWIQSLDEDIEPAEIYPKFVTVCGYTFKNPDRMDPIV